jgi:hypothetical protein
MFEAKAVIRMPRHHPCLANSCGPAVGGASAKHGASRSLA